jgi:glycosyltransferase involved in cell wall biosynthesis
MKIVYVVESLELAGGVKVIVEHAEELAGRGHDVSIVTKHVQRDWMTVRVPVAVVGRFDATTLPSADVHVATWFPTVVPTVRAGTARKVFHLSQGYEALYPNMENRLDEIDEAYRQDVPKLLTSRHLIALFEGRFPGPYFVIPPAIRAADYEPVEGKTAPAAPPVIGVVGPFEAANKGIRVALAAVLRLRAAGREVRVHRASQLPLGAAESALCPPDLYLHGASVSGMARFYRGVDLMIHPSFEAEGFPVPPFEAMASGVPIVLTDIPSFDPLPSDLVSRVRRGDDEAMARESARLLDDAALWARRRERGLELARGEYTLRKAGDVLEKILLDVSGPA